MSAFSIHQQARTRFHLVDAARPGTADSLSIVDARSDPGDALS